RSRLVVRRPPPSPRRVRRSRSHRAVGVDMSARRSLPQRRYQANERDTHRAIIQHLAWRAHPDAFCFHVPLGGYRRPVESAILKSLGTVAGIPDLVCILYGRVCCLEIKKAECGRVSAVQRVVHERLRRAGAEVAVAFGLEEALAQLTAWGILRGNR